MTHKKEKGNLMLFKGEHSSLEKSFKLKNKIAIKFIFLLEIMIKLKKFRVLKVNQLIIMKL